MKAHAWSLKSTPCHVREKKLRQLGSTIERHESQITEALLKDFQKAPAETLLTEILPLLHEIKNTLKNLSEWMEPQAVSTPLVLTGTQSAVQLEAKGTVLIISPWNYPFQLALGPLIPAVAAGNNIILKPSEFTPAINEVIKNILRECFTPDEVCVVEGGAEVTTELLKLPFDHIFFTGSTQVGKIVMAAAAKNLSSVTLELGGKSPTIVDETADLEIAARKIAWGKSVNAGQTCVAPDYVFAHFSIASKLNQLILKFHQEMYPNVPSNNDYAAIISERHRDRLCKMISEMEPEKAVTLQSSIKLPLQTFLNPPLSSQMMSEEIFGPILPILTYENLSEVIRHIQNQPKPLALYLFTSSSDVERRVLSETSSGGVLINDTLLHLGNHYLPFGGVGSSGLGNYHGYFGFKAFSHEKAVMRQGYFGRFLKLLYAPYKPWKEKVIRFLGKV